MPAASRADEIADSAAAVFQRYGLRKTSMDDLATAAGLSRQGLYLHFRTKEALFHASLRRILQRQREGVAQALAPDGRHLRDRLSAALACLHSEYTAVYHGTTAELIDAAATLGRSLLDETTRDITAQLAGALAEAPRHDRPADAGQLAALLLSAVVGAAHLYPGDNGRDRIDTALTVVLAGSRRVSEESGPP
ncbi:TetR/AcrR family transcriptional regulator [Actinoplanes sp. NPDC026670]|uniref:TetR/AcrR family transcriptional regulator n=1 Tax=Actinoplanes sp. NPDC026670 TaxID=3154700 RepID=UPI0033ECD823